VVPVYRDQTLVTEALKSLEPGKELDMDKEVSLETSRNTCRDVLTYIFTTNILDIL